VDRVHLPLIERSAEAHVLLPSASAAGTRLQRSPLSIDISCLQRTQQETRRPRLLTMTLTDGQIDGQTT